MLILRPRQGETRDRDAGPDAIIFSATVLGREMRGFWAGSTLWGSGGTSVGVQRCGVKLAYLVCCAHDRYKVYIPYLLSHLIREISIRNTSQNLLLLTFPYYSKRTLVVLL